MKAIVVCLLFAFAQNAVSSPLESKVLPNYNQSIALHTLNFLQKLNPQNDQTRATAEANDYFVKLFENLREYLLDHSYDPMELPNVGTDFKWLLITGELSFKNGWMNGLSTVKPEHDAIITYKKKVVSIKVPFVFTSILCNYKYTAQFMHFGPKGGMDCKFEDVKMKVHFAFNVDDMKITLKDFQMTDAGKLSITWSGHVLVDWVANIFTKVTLKFMELTILNNVLSVVIKIFIKIVLGKINTDIQNILQGNMPQK